MLERQRLASDAARAEHDPAFPRRVARRRKQGQRTARENVADLTDPGTFVEYGRLRVAGQRKRRSLEDLINTTPADAIVTGIACVNGDQFPSPSKSRAVIMAYDATVLAGTQGAHGHHKTDRIVAVAARMRLPVIWLCEGGGGRPGDTEGPGSIGAGLAVSSFTAFGRLSGLVPLVGVVSGYCFAGNAAFLGCCDVIIATKISNVGMAGPAMIVSGHPQGSPSPSHTPTPLTHPPYTHTHTVCAGPPPAAAVDTPLRPYRLHQCSHRTLR